MDTKKIQYKGAVYVEADTKGTDSLATWLESKGVEIHLTYRAPTWSMSIQGPNHNVSASGKSLQTVLERGCKLFGHMQS